MKKNALALFNTGKNLLQRNTGNDCTTTAVKKTFESGMEMIVGFKVPNCAKKADYTQALKELKRMGVSQKASAFLTGMSQSYVSKLLKK